MKIKTAFNRFLNVLNKISVFIDVAFIFWFMTNALPTDRDTLQNVIYYGALILAVVLLYRYVRAWIHIIKSKMDRDVYMLNNRVIAVCGKQRVGKTSLSVYFAKNALKVYTNVPMRINKKYTYKLTTDILTLKTRIEDKSILVVDEANLFYNNTISHEDKTLFGQGLLCQCVGHFFDGNICYIATDINRMPKLIRDEWSSKLQVLKSRSYRYSIIGDFLIKCIYRLVNREGLKFTGVRLWDCQQYETIEAEQYISLLGLKENENKFSPMYTFADFQGIGRVEYDDRYMNEYYTQRPYNKDLNWDSLQLNSKDFNDMYDGIMIKYLKELDDDIKPKQHFKQEVSKK